MPGSPMVRWRHVEACNLVQTEDRGQRACGGQPQYPMRKLVQFAGIGVDDNDLGAGIGKKSGNRRFAAGNTSGETGDNHEVSF